MAEFFKGWAEVEKAGRSESVPNFATPSLVRGTEFRISAHKSGSQLYA
jgi:hypothetical protein